MAEVYRLLFPSGKSYIGRTRSTAEQRFRQHIQDTRKGGSRPVHNAIRKYGRDSVRIEILAQGISWEESAIAEVEWVARLGTVKPGGYNLTKGGEGVSDPTGEVGAKISRALRGRKVPESVRVKMARANRDPEKRGRLAASLRTPESRQRMAESIRQRFRNPEQRRQMAESQRGRKATEATRQKMSTSQKRAWQKRKDCDGTDAAL